MSIAITELILEVHVWIPENLISGLENKRFGKGYLIELDAKLNKLIKEGSFC